MKSIRAGIRKRGCEKIPIGIYDNRPAINRR